MRIAVCCAPGSVLFLPAVEKALRAGGHNVRRFVAHEHQILADVLAWQAEAVFVEWGGAVAAHLSQNLTGMRMIVRVHRFEVFEPAFSRIRFGGSVWPIVTSKHVLDRALAVSPECGPVLVPNIVDMDAFPLRRHVPGPLRIAVVGYIEGRKQPGLALEAFHAIRKDWRATLTFVGEAKDRHWPRYIADHGGDDVAMMPWTDDPASIWKGHDVVLSASADEGCPFNVCEAMASGATPLVYSFDGARDMFPPECVWDSVDDLVRTDGALETMRNRWTPANLRAWAQEHWSIEAVGPKLCGLFA